ncbi:MFS transporter [Georgenia sp. SUBG003]|uniref:MFS transporter n=1 Tax=Georgenia sp. SUBG003 TaxID=1497974 RepID=UPI000693AF94
MTVWGAGLVAYVVATTGRTSLGVAGLQAAERFGISASVLSLFVVVQLAVYAAAQVPVGMVLDKVGSRKVIFTGALILAGGQLMLALVDTLPLALAARALVGVGDATAFVSVLRLVPAWFPGQRVPLLTQMTGIVGQTGQIVSAVPFLALLLGAGWTTAFASLAAAGVFVGLVVLVVVRDHPTVRPGRRSSESVQPVGTGAEVPAAPVPAAATRVPIAVVLREPGTWLGFFTHFVCLFPTNTFMLLWGVPFLTAGQGVSTAAASSLLTLAALTGVVTGPVTGLLQSRHPLRRSWLVLGAVAATVVVWATVLLPSTPRPTWQLALLVVVLTVSATASNIGFDFARTFVQPERLGTATGLVNVGGVRGVPRRDLPRRGGARRRPPGRRVHPRRLPARDVVAGPAVGGRPRRAAGVPSKHPAADGSARRRGPPGARGGSPPPPSGFGSLLTPCGACGQVRAPADRAR